MGLASNFCARHMRSFLTRCRLVIWVRLYIGRHGVYIQIPLNMCVRKRLRLVASEEFSTEGILILRMAKAGSQRGNVDHPPI